MEAKDDLFIWGDNWWIEGDKAWFVWGMENILFCLDMNTGKCKSAVCIPDTNPKTFRLTPYCIKCGDNIFCLPGTGNRIWIYDLRCHKFSNIDIDNPSKCQLGFDFWVCGDKLWAVSPNEFRKVLEIDTIHKKIENYYTICEEGTLARSVMVDSAIYTLTLDTNQIYEFDMRTKETEAYTLSDIRGKLWTICFDGEKFWLSGFQKEIYLWDKKAGTIDIITDFPEGFGVYDFAKETTVGEADCISEQYEYHIFNFSVTAGNKVWFIPYNANKILYINKGNKELCAFEICEENETIESIMARTSLGYKYLFEYVKDDRYLGIFSIKNNCILEIDTVEMRYMYKQFDYCADLGVECLMEYTKRRDGILYEQIPWYRKVYQEIIKTKSVEFGNINRSNIGQSIYKKINADSGE